MTRELPVPPLEEGLMSERSESSYDMFISQARLARAWVEGYLPMSLTKSAPSCAKDLLQPPFCP